MTAYSEIAAVNFSSLKLMDKGPLHYKAGLARKFKQTSAMAMGSAVHTLVLEADQFDSRYCINDMSRNSNAFKEALALETDAGRTMIKSKDYELARRIAQSVNEHPVSAGLLDGAVFEQTLTWNMHGFNCKGRTDAMRTNNCPVLIDLKTTVDPQPWAFGKQVYDMRYHSQMAFYAAGMVEMYRCKYPEAYLIAVAKTEPFECVVYKLPLPVMDAGEQMYMKWLNALKECREADRYQSRYDGVQELELPVYAVNAEAETSLIIGGQEVTL